MKICRHLDARMINIFANRLKFISMIISTICFNSLWKGLRIYTKNSRNPIKNFPPASYYVYKSPFPGQLSVFHVDR